MSDIEIIQNENTVQRFQPELSEDAKEFIQASQALNTQRAYRFDLTDFNNYLQQKGINGTQVDGQIISNYLSHLAKNGFKVSTIQRRLVSIRALYTRYGSRIIENAKQQGNHVEFHNPADSLYVKETMKGIRRKLGVAPKQKKAATKEIVEAILSEMGNTLSDTRNKAIISLGFAGAFRRSEIAALDVEDIEEASDGITILVKRSKTDQDGHGQKKFIYYGSKAKFCPVRLLQRWLRESGIKSGPIFRRIHGKKLKDRMTDKAIYDVIKKAAENAGFDKAEFAGHSLRRGFITTTADMGAEERDIMRHTGHRSIQTMRRYIEDVDIKKNNPTKGLW